LLLVNVLPLPLPEEFEKDHLEDGPKVVTDEDS